MECLGYKANILKGHTHANLINLMKIIVHVCYQPSAAKTLNTPNGILSRYNSNSHPYSL